MNPYRRAPGVGRLQRDYVVGHTLAESKHAACRALGEAELEVALSEMRAAGATLGDVLEAHESTRTRTLAPVQQEELA